MVHWYWKQCLSQGATRNHQLIVASQLLHKKARLEWSECCNVPIHMSKPQAVGMGAKVTVGGGDTTDKQVFRYDSSTNESNHVPPHCVKGFAMAQFRYKSHHCGRFERVYYQKKFNSEVHHSKGQEQSQEWMEFFLLLVPHHLP